MDFNSKNKKFGFTLMEVLIAVFIVAILTMITVPIVTRQLEKSEEYSYYLAYKTVEKMAGQIVVIGDDEIAADSFNFNIAHNIKDHFFQINSIAKNFNLNKIKYYYTLASQRFISSEDYIFRKLFPVVLANTYTTEELSWNSSTYDELWLAYHVCNNETIKKATTSTTNPDGSTTTSDKYYTKADFNNCIGYTQTADGTYADQNLESLLAASVCTGSLSTARQNILAQSAPDASAFCTGRVKVNCAGTKSVDGITKSVSVVFNAEETVDDEGDDEGDDEPCGGNTGVPCGVEGYIEPPQSATQGTCSVASTFEIDGTSPGTADETPDRPTFPSTYCTAHGYMNMINNAYPDAVDCQCKAGYIKSYNNDRACFLPCTDETQVPYADNAGNKVCCSTDFNQNTGKCCPEKSSYNGSECVCTQGYDMVGNECVPNGTCTKGSTWDPDSKVCVVNPPLLKATRFCELIVKYWNINSSYCSGFTNSDGMNYNQQVFNAAKGNNNGNFLSIDAQTGAFKNIKPNIVFSNGLKLWILSDRQVSIPGLSYTSVDVTPTTNVCKNLNKHNAAACANSNGFFCKNENNCFTLDAASLTFMKDARNCCGSADLSDLAVKTQTDPTYNKEDYLKDSKSYAISGFTVFVDINGDKGEGTLWNDVYPFYITSLGTVFPGYPLDAPKSAESGSNALYLGGNSEKQLPVDVYYYESTNETREKKIVFPNVSFARGVCSARNISKYTPYCMNLGEKYFNNTTKDGNTIQGSDYINNDDYNTSVNPCDKFKCFVSVRRKLKSF